MFEDILLDILKLTWWIIGGIAVGNILVTIDNYYYDKKRNKRINKT